MVKTNNTNHTEQETEVKTPAIIGPDDWRTRLRGVACITLQEAAPILSTPAGQLRKLCREGKINPITGLGRKYRIAVSEIERLLSQQLRNN